MTNQTFLLNHAKSTVWSSPQQDLQTTIKIHRLTNDYGVKKEFAYNFYQTYLPTVSDVYHVFQIGRLHPALVGLLTVRHAWVSCSAHMNVKGMIIDVFNQKGLRLPLFDVFMKVLGNDNLIVAIRDQGNQMRVPNENIFMRFYSNAYFESPESSNLPRLPESAFVAPIVGDWTYLDDMRASSHPGDIATFGGRLRTRDQLQALQLKVVSLRAMGFGAVTCYYNGEIVPDFSAYYYNASRFKINDWAELVFDASIDQIQYLKIADLTTFLSIKDEMTKYILMRDIAWDGTVYYKDDFDFYLVKPIEGQNRYRGRTYYRNVPKAVRMITHQDYAIPTQFVAAYEDMAGGFDNMMSWSVMIVFRRSGYGGKHLFNEHSRLNELFKLTPEKRLRAFRGIDSTVPWWKAAELEASNLSLLMGERPFNFTTEDVEESLGYHAISELVNPGFIPTPLSGDGLTRQANLPVGMWGKGTVFEYDASGKLLGYRTTEGSILYICSSTLCRYIECRIGTGGKYQNTLFGNGPHQLDPDWDYGYFKRPMINGKPAGQWTMADPSDYTVDSRNRVWWNISDVDWLLVIRTNQTFLLYDISVDARDSLTIFSVQSIEDDESEPINRVEDLPFASLDLFFNDRPLVRGIDYTGSWPRFVITNTKWIDRDHGGLQKVTIRAQGLPTVVDNKPVESVPTEVGFVKYGRLSRNKRYTARTGKVQRFVVAGQVLPKEKLNFAEDKGPLVPSPAQNGDPYSIEEVVNPVGNFTTVDSYTLRSEDVERDAVIEDYMGQFFNEEPQPNPNPILRRYEVVSPFMAKIIKDMRHGLLTIPPTILPLTQTKLANLLKDYLYLLPFDPCVVGMDWDYVIALPHSDVGTIELGVYEYSVIDLANKIYLNEILEFASLVRVNAAWKPTPLPPL